MAKKKIDPNVIEIDGVSYTLSERSRDKSEVISIPYSIETYVEKILSGKISRDVLIQRTDDQWTNKQRSTLIETILHNRPIGMFAVASGRSESKSYTVLSLLEGLQRSTAIVDYKQDKFALNKKAKPISCIFTNGDGKTVEKNFEIAGKKYSQLPIVIQMFFNDYRLEVHRYCNFSDDELDEIVFCLNNGKSPTVYQKLRFALGSAVMRHLQPMCDSTLWDSVKGCTAKKDSILGCIVRTLMMMTFYNYKILNSTSMMKFADDDFDDYVDDSVLANLATLIEEFSEVKAALSDKDISKFDSMTVPHYIMSLDAFKKKGKTVKEYIAFLNKFWNSENFKLFVLSCKPSDKPAKEGGNSLYSAEMVGDRQYVIDDYMDEYLDECKENNITMNEGEINGKEINSDEDREAGDVDCGNNGNETDFISDVLDTEIVSDDSRVCDSPSGVEPKINEGGNVLQGGEQGAWSA